MDLPLVGELRQRGVGFKSLCDGVIDTTTASGELIFHIFTALGSIRAAVGPGADQCRFIGSSCQRTPRRQKAHWGG